MNNLIIIIGIYCIVISVYIIISLKHYIKQLTQLREERKIKDRQINEENSFENKQRKAEFEKIFIYLKKYAYQEGIILDKKRKKNTKEKNIVLVLIIATIISLILGISLFEKGIGKIFLMIFIASFISLQGFIYYWIIKAIISFVSFISKPSDFNYEKYKTKIISKFVKLINDNLLYIPEKSLNSEVFDKMKRIYIDETTFPHEYYNIYNLNDYICGELFENVFFRMCDLYIYWESMNGTINNVFQGQFVCIDFNKNIDVNIKITKNDNFKDLKYKKLEMDSIEFEQYFDVYTNNNLETMKILTADLMELLIEFRKKIIFDIEIRGDRLYIRFFTGSILEYSPNKEKYYDYYCILKFIFELSEKISKNINEKNDIY